MTITFFHFYRHDLIVIFLLQISFADQVAKSKDLSASARFLAKSGKKGFGFKKALDASYVSKKLGASKKLLNVIVDLSDSSDSDSDSDSDESEVEDIDADFDSVFAPEEMRCLALIAHNHMKPSIRAFVEANQNLLKKFRLTGTNTTMKMLKEVFGDDPSVVYGPTCQSGPLGGDAEIAAQMCIENLGGMIFFQDPMDAHPHSADIDCLNRQALVHNVITFNNPASAYAGMFTFREALKHGKFILE